MNQFQNYPTGRILIVGFLLILILVTGLGRVAWLQTEQLWTQTSLMYNHPLRVRTAVDAFRADVLVIHRAMKDLVFVGNNPDARVENLQIISVTEADAFRQLDILDEWFLGAREEVDSLRDHFVEWGVVRKETIRLADLGYRDEAARRTLPSGEGGQHAARLLRSTRDISDFAANKAKLFLQEAENTKQTLTSQLFYFFLGTVLMALLVFLFIYRYIQEPLRQLIHSVGEFRRGSRNTRVRYKARNEFGELSLSFNQMIEALAEQQTVDEHSDALTVMMLRETDAENFSRRLLSLLIQQTGAQQGVVYLLNATGTSFEPFESIGFSRGAPAVFSVDQTEGEFGTALATGQMQHIVSPSSSATFKYLTVSGEVQAAEIITMPLEAGGKVIAVISLATIGSFSSSSTKLLRAVHQIIGARMNGILSFRMIQNQANILNEQNQELELQKHELTLQTVELGKMNAELEQQKMQLDEASRLKSTFLSNMSHELRTPLNSVIALSGVLDRRLKGVIPDEEYHYLEIIGRNGRSLLALINDILDLSRIEAGREDVYISSFRLKDLADDLVSVLAPQAHEKGIELVNRISPDLPAVQSDHDKCLHILQNILGNAVKFTETGVVELSANMDDNRLEISIRDTGIGISEAQLPHIFDEFRQADDSSSRRFGGTGLGLSIASKYAALLKGGIMVESKPGKGSTFILTLPVRFEGSVPDDRDQYSTARHKAVNYQTIGEGNGHTVLVVDDSEPALIQMTDILCTQGYRVLHAHNGFEALEQLASDAPDAIVLDLMMPGMDGFEVLRTVRAQHDDARIPVLILTARQVTPQELKLLKSNNIHQLIQKGDVNRMELLAAVARMIALQQSRPVPGGIKRTIPPKTEPITILVVEDNPDNMATMKALLHGNSTVLEAGNGKAAVEMTLQHQPDLLLMDLALPEMNGFEALVEIRKHQQVSHIPVVAVTASVMKGDREKVLAFGFDRYVPKPVDVVLLWQVINDLRQRNAGVNSADS